MYIYIYIYIYTHTHIVTTKCARFDVFVFLKCLQHENVSLQQTIPVLTFHMSQTSAANGSRFDVLHVSNVCSTVPVLTFLFCSTKKTHYSKRFPFWRRRKTRLLLTCCAHFLTTIRQRKLYCHLINYNNSIIIIIIIVIRSVSVSYILSLMILL
jgi:hypothetical protein